MASTVPARRSASLISSPRGWALRAFFNWLRPQTSGAFLDLGSGKGRTLLEAARYGFKRVIGVEYSAQLNAIALQNIERYRSKVPADVVLESLCLDAAEYVFRNDETLIYLFNPFRPAGARESDRESCPLAAPAAQDRAVCILDCPSLKMLCVPRSRFPTSRTSRTAVLIFLC